MIALFLAATLAGSSDCAFEDAVYSLRSDSPVTARFHIVDTGESWPAGLVMELNVEASGRTYWWLPHGGGTSGRSYLASTTDASDPSWTPPWMDDGDARPLGDVAYWGFDEDYMWVEGFPRRGAPAHAHVFLPDLGEALWYGQTEHRDGVARQFFDLTACSGQPVSRQD